MPHLLTKTILHLVMAAFLAGFAAWTGPFPSAVAQDDPPTIVEDEDVPPGVAAGWIVGNRLLAEGKTAEALPYLHQAYRAHPGVVTIALDFQEALASEGYLRDALSVMDELVAAWPDSQSFRMRRSSLNLSAGHRDKALDDLRAVREMGDASVEVLAAEAAILAADGKTSQAVDVLRDGLHLYPERGRDIYLEMARILRQADEVEALPGLMDEALEAYPDQPLLWLVKIRSLASLGRHEEALDSAREADGIFAELPNSADPENAVDSLDVEFPPPVAEHPGLPADSFSVELADYYAQNNQVDLALGILQPLADSGELGLSPSLWLGRLLLGTGREEEGVALVERILTQWPDSGRGWFLRGKIEEGHGNWTEAIPHYQRAVELAPYDPEIRLGLVRAMLVAWEGDLRAHDPNPSQQENIAEFNVQTMTASSLVNDRDTEGQMLLGYSFRALKDMERAAWRFNLAAENPSLRLQALLQQSICLDETGEVAKARLALELLRREYPDDPEVANSLGYFLSEKGQDLDLAEGLIREALAADPGNGAYLDSLGWVMYRHGRLEEAFDFLIQAINVLPDDPVILEHLGMVLDNQGQSEEALDVLRRSLQNGGDPDRLQNLIAEIEKDLPDKE